MEYDIFTKELDAFLKALDKLTAGDARLLEEDVVPAHPSIHVVSTYLHDWQNAIEKHKDRQAVACYEESVRGIER